MVIWESNIVLHEIYLFCPNVNNCGSSFGITYILRAVFWFLANNRQSNTMNIDLESRRAINVFFMTSFWQHKLVIHDSGDTILDIRL